ncbi:MAG: STAS/SEC14 domain-containing protein [Alphaproteobacteria bacterium]|nr:MAG: STAS/SEC14 domain-containing protein [Alphaproteobacteria bacterium]
MNRPVEKKGPAIMITRLSAPQPDLLGFALSGRVSHEDYANVLIPAIEQAVARGRKARVLVRFEPDFAGYEAHALVDDTRLGIRHWHDFARVALVGAPRWVATAVRLFAPFWPCTVRLFAREEEEAAWAWLAEDEEDGPPARS